MEDAEEFGSSTNIRIDFNFDNISNGVVMGADKMELITATTIHEIRHNLGGEHSDNSPAMQNVVFYFKSECLQSVNYPHVTEEHLGILYRRRNSQKPDLSAGRIWNKK
ncbi:MAG: hypothetical protein IJ543_00845 [Bacteroidales bacterium]|nr:hypothetical protein [Bacteroidales bacterium]